MPRGGGEGEVRSPGRAQACCDGRPGKRGHGHTERDACGWTRGEDGRPYAGTAALGRTGPAHAWILDLQPPGGEEAHLRPVRPQNGSSEAQGPHSSHSCLSGALFSLRSPDKLVLETDTAHLARLTAPGPFPRTGDARPKAPSLPAFRLAGADLGPRVTVQRALRCCSH